MMNNSSEVLIQLLTGSSSFVLGIAANRSIKSVIKRYRKGKTLTQRPVASYHQ